MTSSLSREQKGYPESGSTRSSRFQNIVLCLLLGLATFAIYAPVAHFSFVNYDDGDYVFNNTHVENGLTRQNIRWALTGIASGNWHPLTWLSHQLDCQLYGLRAGGHHVTSVLLHVFNVVLLFLLLYRATGARGRSFFVAALFALHPFNVESVAWVAERKNVLCTLFFLLALGAYGWYVQRPGIKRYLLVAAMFVLGLASKPMVITLPFVLLLLDYWPFRRTAKSDTGSTFPAVKATWSQLVLEKIPLFLLSIASAVITMLAQRSAHAVQPLSAFSLTVRLENAVYAYAQYLWKAFLPRELAPFYPVAPLSFWQLSVAIAFLSLLGLCVWKLSPGRPYLLIGSLWFFGTLVPVIGLVQVGVQSMADRYTYVPLLGVFTAAVWGIAAAAERWRWDRRWITAAAVAVLLLLSWVTARQVTHWRDSTVLWAHALRVTVSNYVAEENLAVSLANSGRDEEALPHFLTVREIHADDSTALLNIGMWMQKHEKYQQAIEAFETVVRTAKDPNDLPRLTAAYRGLGIIYAALGNRSKARENFRQAARLSPSESTELLNMSIFDAEEGAESLSKVLSAHPTAEGYAQLGQLLRLSRRMPDAQVAYEKALRLNPNLVEAKQALQELKGAAQ